MLGKHTGSPSTHATPRTTIAFSTSVGCDVQELALVGAGAPAPDGADQASPAPAGAGSIGGRP